MIVEWREREHEEEDDAIFQNMKAINVLLQCGLLKKNQVPNVKAQKKLLQKLVDYQDPVDEAFVLDEDVIHIEMDEIYFLTGFS